MRPARPLLIAPLLVLVAACGRDEAVPVPAADPAPAATPAVAAPAPPPAVAPTHLDDLVRADDTLATLQQRLGAGNVVTETLAGGEGDTLSGWTLYPDDPTRRLSVYLDDGGANPMMLLAGREATAWTRSDGVRIGMTSQELAQLNGGAFAFMGFDWDYGGVVTDWRGGRLAPDGASAGPVTLCPPETADGSTPDDYPVGDNEFPSNDQRLLLNPAHVCEFGVNIDPPAPEPEAD